MWIKSFKSINCAFAQIHHSRTSCLPFTMSDIFPPSFPFLHNIRSTDSLLTDDVITTHPQVGLCLLCTNGPKLILTSGLPRRNPKIRVPLFRVGRSVQCLEMRP